jgi:hypothetical protein
MSKVDIINADALPTFQLGLAKKYLNVKQEKYILIYILGGLPLLP